MSRKLWVLPAAGCLLLVLSGGAFAASRYLITSTRQIKPSVLRQLHGATGPAGPAGTFSSAGVATVSGPSAPMCASSANTCAVGSSVATCPAGDIVLSGGYDGETDPPVDATAGYDEPLGSNGWEVIMSNNALIPASFHAIAVCVPAASAASDAATRPNSRNVKAIVARQVAAMQARDR
jgi:hypothetical protein